jgi:hypothetical protein
MKKMFTVALVLFALNGFSQTITLSDSAEISVITCGPFQGELYSAFGHSAFRVHDPKNGIDDAYNYGVFDFNQPNFYLNFAKGYLYYKLGVYDYKRFQDYYIYYNRYVHEQVLNLTPVQKQKMFDYLQWNAQPENQHYRYDYFYNNCATMLRDIVIKNFGDSVQFDGSYIESKLTIRQLTDMYLTQQPWGDLGIDICLGLPMDKTASPNEYMFLPDYIESGFDHATIKHNGSTVPLVKVKNSINESRFEETPAQLLKPFYVFSAFAFIALLFTFLDLRRRKLSNWFDAILFGVTGAVGFLLLFLWLFTDHNAAARNMNLLWAMPLNLIAVIFFFKSPKWLKQYFGGLAVLTALLLITWAVLPQQLNTSLIPFVVAILVRAGIQYKLR